MASSYSTDLKLELMVTGENASTWGEKSNNNLNLLQQAIAGYQAIDVASADVTLSMSDASISNARNMVIKLTGTLAGNREVKVPDNIEKFYIVQDATTHGSFSLTFKTVSGSGFTLTQGLISAAFSDGTNITAVNLDTLSGTIGTAQIADDSITTAKILNNNVTSDKILDSNVGTDKIADGPMAKYQEHSKR